MKNVRYLVENDYMADPAVHVFNDRLYIYPSHDWESGIPENDNGDHFPESQIPSHEMGIYTICR